jgi:GT2 family glycosyltransferase
MRFGAYVATFDRPAILRATLQTILQQTRPPEYILVVDNGTDPQTQAVARSFAEQHVGYHHLGHNGGPAGAGAYALPALVEMGYEWIFCGDDDDPPLTPDTFERLLALTRRVRPPVGGVGATGSLWNWRTGTRAPLREVTRDGVGYVDAIGGGRQLIVSRDAVLKAGPPRAELFFGQEDFEFCLRIRKAGFNMAVDAALFGEYARLIHERRTAPPPVRGTLRPPADLWRQYYNSRNYIHFVRREFGSERLAAREALKALGRCLVSWRRGWRYGLQFSRMQLRGVADGYRDRLGVRVLPGRKHETRG